MKDRIESIVKNYYESEVTSRKAPPFPGYEKPEYQIREKYRKKRLWDNIFLAACVLGSLLLTISPITRNSPIEKLYIPMSRYKAFKDEIPRVIFDASIYFKKKGVNND